MDKHTITKVKKDSDGSITDVMFENGEVHSIEEAINMAKQGILEEVLVGKTKNGKDTLRSRPNNTPTDNLDSLPTF